MFILNFSLLNFFILILIFFLNYKKIINLIFFLFLYFLIHYFQNFLIFVEHIIQNLDCFYLFEISQNNCKYPLFQEKVNNLNSIGISPLYSIYALVFFIFVLLSITILNFNWSNLRSLLKKNIKT